MSAPGVDVLLVRGAPGVGKSSAVRAARSYLPDGAVIEVDDLRGMIAAVRWQDRRHHEISLDHAGLLVHAFLAGGFAPVLVVDTFSRGLADPFARRLGRPYRIASLVADEAALHRRIEGRPASQFRDHETSRALNEQTRRDRFEHDVLIDTSELTPGEVATRLASILRGAV